jgi:hypothetical protein
VSENKREFERFDLSVITHFGPTDRATQKSLGLTKNFSREGLSLETRDFNFEPAQNLELELRSPRDNSTVSLEGNVVWRKKVSKSRIAGIKLIFKDENIQNELLETISSYMDKPAKKVFHITETHRKIKDKHEGKSEEELMVEQKDIPSEQAPERGFKKQHLKKGECKVTFRLPKEAVQDAKSVTIAGDFNEWDTTATPMTQLKDGSFQITMNLPAEREYRFRYLIDGTRWENDWCADKYIPNDYGADDSVVIV